MKLIGRWEKVRMLGMRGWGLPYMVDRKWGRVIPHAESGEWWKSPDGIWMPTIRGGTGFSYRGLPRATLWSFDVSAFSPSAVTINNVLTVGTSEIGVAARAAIPQAETLTDLYYYCSSALTGAPTFKWEIRTSNGNAPDTTAPGLLASGTSTPTGNSWNRITGLSVSLAGGAVYWFIIGGNSADASNKVDLQRAGLNENSGTAVFAPYCAASTGNGWSGASSTFNAFASISAVFSSGRVVGDPYTAETGTVSTNRRGIRIGSLEPNIGIFGVFSTSGAASGSNGAELWLNANGPSGTPDAASVLQTLTDVGSISGYMFGSAQKIPSGSTARLVFKYSGGGGSPTKVSIGTGSDANLKAMMFGEGAWYWAQASGTTDWSNDDTAAFPRLNLMVEDIGGPGTPLAFSVSDGLR